MRLLLLALLSTTFLACPDPRPPPIEDDDGGIDGGGAWPAGALVVGVTDDVNQAFVPMTAETELHAGFQGGFHVPMAYKVFDQAAENAEFQHKVRRVSDGALLSRGSRQYTVEASDAGWVAMDISAFLCPTPSGLDAVDTLVRFEVVVVSPDGGTLATTSQETTLRCPSGNSFCQQICKG